MILRKPIHWWYSIGIEGPLIDIGNLWLWCVIEMTIDDSDFPTIDNDDWVFADLVMTLILMTYDWYLSRRY